MNEWDKEYDKHRSITAIGTKPTTEAYDNVHKPKHYIRCGVECKDMIKAAVDNLSGFEAYAIGNAIKYLWRWKDKNGTEDLKKAREYIDMLIEEEDVIAWQSEGDRQKTNTKQNIWFPK